MKFAIAALAAALAMNAVLSLAQFGFAAPRSLADYFFGQRLIRAEVVLKENGLVRDYRLDRGRVQAVSVGAGTITLIERDGMKVVIPVAPNARIQVNGSSTSLGGVRRKMTAFTVREGESPAHIVRASGSRRR
ncbi:MAG: hypothetical protein M3M94_05780 [Actinomycetota bacterium]|nr:hypothetical protein [Actinomycetota bacterium]